MANSNKNVCESDEALKRITDGMATLQDIKDDLKGSICNILGENKFSFIFCIDRIEKMITLRCENEHHECGKQEFSFWQQILSEERERETQMGTIIDE